jgi:hypothetical protein
MLPDRYQQLLTAFVDGELSAKQRRAAARLLHRSPEARELLGRLQEDARRLRGLPAPRLGRDLSGDVVRAIQARRLRPAAPRRRVLRPTPAVPAWAGLAAAAAVLLVVGLASYLYFASALDVQTAAAVARNAPKELDPVRPAPPGPGAPQVAPRPEGRTPAAAPRPEAPPLDAVARSPRPGKETAPVVGPPAPEPSAPRYDDISAAPHMEIFKPESFTANLPLVLKLHDLDGDAGRQTLLGDLRKSSAFRVELPCRHGTRAFERLQAALKAQNIAVALDPAAQARLRIPQLKTNFVLYAEGLTPEELAGLLRQASGEDRRAAKPQEPPQFDSLVVTRMTARDRKELTDLLGADPFQPAPKPAGPLGTDPHKPLAEQTADQVAKSLAGQGGPPRPEPGKPAAKPAEHTVLALAYNPVRPRAGSAEVKRFLDARKPARPGTLQILLVLRGT